MPVSITIKNLKVRSLDVDMHQVTWELAETSEDVLDYTFQVLRSESPSGPFDVVMDPVRDGYIFIDKSVPIGDRWRMLHYLVRVTHLTSGEFKDFGPVTKEPEADLIALELRRHMQLLFHEHAGRKCWVLPIRTFGQRCDCWDRTFSKRSRSRCIRCFDTGFIRGYMAPIEAWIQFDPSPKTNQVTNVGPQQQSNTTLRMGYYPPLKPMDLIVEPENRRWHVVSVSQTEHVRAPIHQEIQVHEVPPRDIEMDVPLLMEQALKDIWFSHPRNFTNPTGLHNVENTDTADPFAIYDTYVKNPGGFGQ